MHSSTTVVITLALVAATAPAVLAAPTAINHAQGASGALSFPEVGDDVLDFIQGAAPVVKSVADIVNTFSGGGKRDVEDLLRRELLELQARQESGALSWADVENFENKVLDTVQAITPAVTSAVKAYGAIAGKREDYEVLRRELLVRAFAHDILEARQASTSSSDQSGAITFQDVKDFAGGFRDGFTKTASATPPPLAGLFVRREEPELLARDEAAYVARSLYDLD